jgi:hypothetical protein
MNIRIPDDGTIYQCLACTALYSRRVGTCTTCRNNSIVARTLSVVWEDRLDLGVAAQSGILGAAALAGEELDKAMAERVRAAPPLVKGPCGQPDHFRMLQAAVVQSVIEQFNFEGHGLNFLNVLDEQSNRIAMVASVIARALMARNHVE